LRSNVLGQMNAPNTFPRVRFEQSSISFLCSYTPTYDGKDLLKVAPKQHDLPPKGKVQSIISCDDLSSISTHCRLVIATSSEIIRDALLSNSVGPLCFEKPHKRVLSILIGILNLECAVHPPGMMDMTIPDVVVAIALRSMDCNFARKALYRYVFLDPLRSSTKNTRPLPLMI
jgi:hypothetical protein